MSTTEFPPSGDETVASTILERIRSRSAGLSVAEQRVAVAVLADPSAVIHLSVTELAQVSASSPATVVRFCRSIELRGYRELKLALARATVRAESQPLDEVRTDDGPGEILAKVLTGAANALLEAARAVDGEELAIVADLIAGADRVLFVAVGTSAPLASDVAYRLKTIGVDARYAADAHEQHVSARMLKPGDLCIAISHTGSTAETLTTMRSAAANGTATAAITSFARSPLTELVARVVVAGSRETAYRSEAMTSRIVHLGVLDALFALVVQRRPGSLDALAATAEVLVAHSI